MYIRATIDFFMQQPLFDILRPSAVKEQLYGLWQEAFGDSREFIEAFFTHFPCDGCAHTLSAGGRVVSALYALPCTLRVGGEEHSAAYVYAVVTVADCRGRGYMQLLMERVEELLRCRGVKLLYLLPASPALRDYYSRLGYVTCSARAVEYLQKPLVGGVGLRFEEADFSSRMTDFCIEQQRRNAPSVVHSSSSIAMNFFNCCAQGGGVFAVYEGRSIAAVAFVAVDSDGPLLLECYSASPVARDFILQSLCVHFVVDAMRAFVQGKGEPCCMMRTLVDEALFLPDSVDISLLLDK